MDDVSGSSPSLSSVAAEVRRFDPDRFVTALFAPADRREDLFALYAFNAEVARVRELVREPMIGLMRVQWWRDVVERIDAGGGAPSGHPVAEALARAIDRHRPPRALFDQLLDARDLDMEPRPTPDHGALAAYAEDTGGTVCRLALWMLGGRTQLEQAAASAVGRAWALTGLLRAVPFHAAQDRVYLPCATLSDDARHALLGGRAEPEVRDLVADVGQQAARALAEARAAGVKPGRERVAALLPAVLADGYLQRIARAEHDPFDPRLALPRRRPVMLLLNALRGRF